MTARQQQAMEVFVREGLAVTGAAAVAGALTGESGADLDSTVVRVHADHDSGGIAEWRLDRKTKMVSFVTALGKLSNDLEGQCLFVLNELSNDPRYATLYAELKRGTRPGKDTAGLITTMCWNFTEQYERPDMAVAHMNDIRVPQALKVYNAYVAAAHKTVPPVAQGGVVVGTAAGGGAIATAGQVPPLATILMAAVSLISYLVSAIKIKTPPVPLPIPVPSPSAGPQIITAAILTPMEEFRRDDAIAKAALIQRQKSLDKVRAQAAELQEIMSHEDVKVIDHDPNAANRTLSGTPAPQT